MKRQVQPSVSIVQMKQNWSSKFLSAALSSLICFSTSTTREVRAQDAEIIGMMVGGLGAGMILASGVDSIKSASNCACQATGCKATVPWEDCAMLGVGVAGVVAGIATMMSGSEESRAVRGSGTNGNNGDYNRNFDPTKPLAPIVCQGDNSKSPACDCSGPNASLNILCGPDSIKNVKKILDSQNLTDTSQLPDGVTVEQANDQNSKASSMLDNLLAGNLGAIDSTSLGEALDGGKSGGLGNVGSDIIGGGSGGPDPFGLGKVKAGPTDRAGLGKISYPNGLDSIDEATGKFLTLWQRNTRRHQGDVRGSRAFFLAKVEFMRKRVSAPATLAAAPSNKAVGATKSPSTQKAVPTPARQPASVPRKLGVKH